MEANRDDNRVTTLLGVSTVDGVTPVKVQINSGNDKVLIDQSNNPARVITLPTDIPRDDNRQVVGLAARTDDGEPFPIMCTPEGKILIEL